MKKEVSDSLIVACRLWLRDEGIEFFKKCLEEHNTVSPIIMEDLYTEEELEENKKKPTKQKQLPHPVHFREGMQVRNWMRTQGETAGWDDHDYDDNWTDLIEKVINKITVVEP